MNSKTFQQENNEILQYILEDVFFQRMKSNDEECLDLQRLHGTTIELYITSVCNQKCEYCYLTKHGDELYPAEIRNKDQILKNLRIFLAYLKERKVHLRNMDLFSGEIWGMDFGNQVLDTILEFLGDEDFTIKELMIPTNATFLLNETMTATMESYIEKFAQKNTEFRFSFSVDGKVIEDKTRPYKINTQASEQKNTDLFYQRLFQIGKKYGFGYHPMVSASAIEYWKENFDWWVNALEKNKIGDIYRFTMFLEVRNDEWTKEKIKSYLDFLDYVFDYFYKVNYYSNIYSMTKDLIFPFSRGGTKNYNIISLHPNGILNGCSVTRTMCVRLGDLAIAPCHRLSYDKLLYGKFNVKDDKITGITANNIQLANKIYLSSTKHVHKCDGCLHKDICIRGCLGSQYESTLDPLLPADSVCDMLKAKYNFLIYKYEKSGMLTLAEHLLNEQSKRLPIMDIINTIKGNPEYIEWKKEYNLC